MASLERVFVANIRRAEEINICIVMDRSGLLNLAFAVTVDS